MNKRLSPYLEFSREAWSHFHNGMPPTLSHSEIEKFQRQIERASIDEVKEIYLPLSLLLNMYVETTKKLYEETEKLLGHYKPKVPFIIGIAGSVGVGKSTTSYILQALLSKWPEHRHVEIVTTDGFLYPNKILEKQQLMERKGFPESYDLNKLLNFLSDLKAGKPNLKVPIYSHHFYDIIPKTFQVIDQPDIVILEGLNILQVVPSKNKKNQLFVSDFFDFSIYVDAETAIIKKWFLERFALFRKQAKKDPNAFFYQFAQWEAPKAKAFAERIWKEINERNLNQNILPYKHRAQLILVKDKSHAVEKIFLRKL